MSTHVPGFQSFLYHFALAKLATSSIRVIQSLGFDYLVHFCLVTEVICITMIEMPSESLLYSALLNKAIWCHTKHPILIVPYCNCAVY